MPDPTPIPLETLRTLFDQAGLPLTDEEIAPLGLAAARTKQVQALLRGMFADVIEPAPVFSALAAYTK